MPYLKDKHFLLSCTEYLPSARHCLSCATEQDVQICRTEDPFLTPSDKGAFQITHFKNQDVNWTSTSLTGLDVEQDMTQQDTVLAQKEWSL